MNAVKDKQRRHFEAFRKAEKKAEQRKSIKKNTHKKVSNLKSNTLKRRPRKRGSKSEVENHLGKREKFVIIRKRTNDH